MLWSPLLLSLIKFSALITIKPLSMYNNVCITEQHRCSPSTQLNIKMAVAVLIATWCASHFLCVHLCTQAKPLQRGLPWYWYCRLETCSTILSATSEPTVYMTYIHCGALCARKASLNEKKTVWWVEKSPWVYEYSWAAESVHCKSNAKLVFWYKIIHDCT